MQIARRAVAQGMHPAIAGDKAFRPPLIAGINAHGLHLAAIVARLDGGLQAAHGDKIGHVGDHARIAIGQTLPMPGVRRMPDASAWWKRSWMGLVFINLVLWFFEAWD